MKLCHVWLFALALILPAMAQTPVPTAPPPAPAPKIAPAQRHYPEPPAPANPDFLGRGVQRTMTLLETSTPQHHNAVRILFYGQSITEQDWSRQVADDLRRRFPNADLQIENRAIGGFADQILRRPAEHDLYPFYPDLLIFHVYGGNQEYEEIIKNVRSRTSAEVLMQLDHATFWPLGTPEAATQGVREDGGTNWDRRMNTEYLPDIARRYGCGLADVRGGWLDYLRANHLEPSALLQDGVHLNAWGNFLMARLIERYLVYRPDLPKTDWSGLSQTSVVGKDIKPNNGQLTWTFTGNRVDALPALSRHGEALACHVLIDGVPPSQDDLYYFTRPQPGPWSTLALVRVDHDKPLLAEDWTLTITSVSPEGTRWTYSVAGSKTGPDGNGNTDAVFGSQSERVRIDPKDFFRPPDSFHPAPVTVGYTIHWQAVPLFEDVYQPPAKLDTTRDQAETLAQGLANGPHTLTLIADGPGSPPVRALRVYAPPVGGALNSATSRTVPMLFPGGVADSVGQTGYVPGATGGMDAIDLATGHKLWHVDGDLNPLMVFQGKVVAQQNTVPANNQLSLAAFDAAHGWSVFLSQPLIFPDWVSTASVGFGTIFASRCYMDAGQFYFLWHATKRQVSGAAPPPGMRLRFQEASGMARVDLTTGNVVMLPLPDGTEPIVEHSSETEKVTLGPRAFLVKEEPAAMNAAHPRNLQCWDAVSDKLLWQYPLKPKPLDLSYMVP